MIYRDTLSSFDFPEAPADRLGEKCMYCEHTAAQHYGWRCPDVDLQVEDFFYLSKSQRYCTESMLNSIKDLDVFVDFDKVEVSVGKDMSDWRNWRHNKAGDCVCGIAKERCDYHR